jgi:hypothetical protein
MNKNYMSDWAGIHLLSVLYLLPALLPFHLSIVAGEEKTVQIKHSDPMVPERQLRRRYKIFNPGYEVSEEEFRVYVPDSYASDVPHGVFVWVSPGDHGKIPSDFKKVFEERRLLAISAKNSGNDRNLNERILMAVEGARYMKRKYTVDDDRKYVSGMSGGSKIASRVTFIYPDFFDGTMYMGGVQHYKKISLTGRQMVSGIFPNIPKNFLAQVRQNRHAYMVGEKDGWQVNMEGAYEHVKKQGWKHVAYFEQPGLDHSTVNTSYFRKGITSLDKPLKQTATRRWKMIENGQGSGGAGDGRSVLQRWRTMRDVWLHAFDAEFARTAQERMNQLKSRANKMATRQLQQTIGKGSSGTGGSTATKLRQFYRRWKGLSTRKNVHDELKNIAQRELRRLQNQRSISAEDIHSLYNRWISFDLDVIDRIKPLYDRESMKASREFAGSDLTFSDLGKLKQFRRRWDGSKAARQALQEIDRILSGAIERIRQQPETKKTNNTLAEIALRFPATESGQEAFKILDKRGQLYRYYERRKQLTGH